jgi:hypothetical protein
MKAADQNRLDKKALAIGGNGMDPALAARWNLER